MFSILQVDFSLFSPKIYPGVARLTLFRPNFRNLDSFQVGWPKYIYLAL